MPDPLTPPPVDPNAAPAGTPPPSIAPPPANDIAQRAEALMRQQARERQKVETERGALSQREQQIIAREQQYAQREAQFRAKEADAQQWQALQAAKSNPIEALQLLGLTPEQVNEAVMSGPQYQINLIEQKIQQRYDAKISEIEQKFEQKLSGLVGAVTEADKRQEKQAIEEMREQVAREVAAHSNDYPLTAITDSASLVAEVIQDYYEKSTKRDSKGRVVAAGRVLSWKEAATEVEAHLQKEPSLSEYRAFLESKKAPAQPAPRTATQPGQGVPRSPQQLAEPHEFVLDSDLDNDAYARAFRGLDEYVTKNPSPQQ